MEPGGCCVSTLRSLHRRPVPDASDSVTVKKAELGPFFTVFCARREKLDRGAVRRPSCGRVEPTGSAESGVSGEKSPNFSKMSLECLDGLQMAWESVWEVRGEVGGRVGAKKMPNNGLEPLTLVLLAPRCAASKSATSSTRRPDVFPSRVAVAEDIPPNQKGDVPGKAVKGREGGKGESGPLLPLTN